MLLILILWFVGCLSLAILNARFWTICPDDEDNQYRHDKSQNSSPVNPVLKDTWHVVKVFILIGLLFFVVWMIVNAF